MLQTDLIPAKSQAVQAHNARSYVVGFFFTFMRSRELSAKRHMGHILYCLAIQLDHTKRDSRLAAYAGVVLQRFEGLNL